MPKERRRSLKEALTCSSSPLGSGKERQGHCSSSQDCDERLPMASARPVPHLTVTAEEGSGARELAYEEAEALNGGASLRRKLSTSSVSSTGSSVALEESEDDVLSDNETKSKGIVTLERLGDAAEVGHEACYASHAFSPNSGWVLFLFCVGFCFVFFNPVLQVFF